MNNSNVFVCCNFKNTFYVLALKLVINKKGETKGEKKCMVYQNPVCRLVDLSTDVCYRSREKSHNTFSTLLSEDLLLLLNSVYMAA